MSQQKLPFSTFPIYKSMETISCHNHQSSYPIGTKKYNYSLPPHIDTICEVWKESASRLQRRSLLKMLTGGRTTDACLYYKFSMSLWLRWAKKEEMHMIFTAFLFTQLINSFGIDRHSLFSPSDGLHYRYTIAIRCYAKDWMVTGS